jgi:hypothetical protein
MLETAIREAEALPIDWSKAFARSDAGQGGRLGEQPRKTVEIAASWFATAVIGYWAGEDHSFAHCPDLRGPPAHTELGH